MRENLVVFLNIDAKRIIDIALSAMLMLATLPIVLVLAVASAVTLRAWPFFVQDRVGRHGDEFRFLKIRTLPPGFEAYADKTALNHLPLPTSMRLLRASHLDELPQLWLVLVGKMSLVGPRPEMTMLHERLSPAAADERVSVRPGITGLWQVSAHCDGLICDRVEYDRLYVRYSSPLLDLWIMAKTVQKMLFGQRVHLFEIPRWAIREERVLDLTGTAPRVLVEPVISTASRSERRQPATVGAK